jgi:DUF971 family protein
MPGTCADVGVVQGRILLAKKSLKLTMFWNLENIIEIDHEFFNAKCPCAHLPHDSGSAAELW